MKLWFQAPSAQEWLLIGSFLPRLLKYDHDAHSQFSMVWALFCVQLLNTGAQCIEASKSEDAMGKYQKIATEGGTRGRGSRERGGERGGEITTEGRSRVKK